MVLYGTMVVCVSRAAPAKSCCWLGSSKRAVAVAAVAKGEAEEAVSALW
jgi:hypothetical protein